MILGLQHVAILISSEECLDFYKKLGFKESYRKSRVSDTVVLMDGHGFQLECFIDGRHPEKSEALDEPLGVRHMALKADDISTTLQELVQNGINAETVEMGGDERY